MENPNVPSLKQQWTGLTSRVKQAFDQPRINQLNDYTELKKLLLQLFTLTGLRNDNFPDKIQTDFLLNFIREDLGNYTVDEILLAFRMAIKNELEIDPNHYQAFSAHYIASIMSAYTKIRTQHLKLIRANENALKLETKMEHTPAELEEIKKGYIFESLIKPFRFYKRTGKLTFGITPFSIIYKTLSEDLDMIKLSKEEKKRIYDQASAQLESYVYRPVENIDEHRKMNLLKMDIENKGFAKAMEYDIKLLCYEITVKELMEKYYKENIDFEKEICDKLNYKFD